MMFMWNYGSDHGGFGRAILTASDRMLTAGDLQYEPPQQKISRLTPTTILMVAGDMTVHTEAITYALNDIRSIIGPKIGEIVDIYANHIRNIRRRRAEALYLEPLGLSIKLFHENQKNMLPQIAVDITNEIRTYTLEVEALIVGCEDNDAFIYQIDGEGLVTHHHELNFSAIGIGSVHAKSYLMFSRYQRSTNYFRALPALYGAKKQAEAAPGVGKETDYYLVTKNDILSVPSEFIEVIKDHYEEEERRKEKDADIIESKLGTAFDAFIARLNLVTTNEASSEAISSEAAEPRQIESEHRQVEPEDGKPA